MEVEPVNEVSQGKHVGEENWRGMRQKASHGGRPGNQDCHRHQWKVCSKEEVDIRDECWREAGD